MKTKIRALLLLFIISISAFAFIDFKTAQLKHPRVKAAYQDTEVEISKLLDQQELQQYHIFLRAFKDEEILELWARNIDDSAYKLVTTYAFCWNSGSLGPKREQGDYQIPEGFYNIAVFNPESTYHLSLGIDYPNDSDRLLGNKNKLGGDIYIHGDCFTIGCIPITDPCIKELYVFAVEAKNNGQTNIPVHIFPTRLSFEFISNYSYETYEGLDHTAFWTNLKLGYDYFEINKTLPKISVSSSGSYIID